jgi:protein translocase SecG subunit
MNVIITIFQIIICLALMGLILLQAQGSGLGSAFGRGSTFYTSKRGIEKFVFWLTIIFTVLFFVSSILNFIY